MPHQPHNLGTLPIADHSFSADRAQLAVARDISVELYDTTTPKYSLLTTLAGHDKTVTSVDIAPTSGRIVTCSQDRNALVWEPQTDGTYKPMLVLLRINRAATFVRWSPDEKKFAVGSGARAIAVCYFEKDDDWWVSRHIKKPLRSTVLSVSWHPNSVLLSAGSTDSHARVFSTFLRGVDEKPEPTAWGERIPFNTVCGDFVSPSGGGWVHDSAFSPSGNALAFVSHDSSVTIVYPSAPDQPPAAIVNVTTTLLPFVTLTWLSENEFVAAGHDCHPVLFSGSGETGWVLDHSLDDPSTAKKSVSKENTALNMFRQMDLKGTPAAALDSTSLPTVHQNTITKLRPYLLAGGRVTKISSSGVDGRVVIFDA
ncbi:WD40-repeat-containing domain protein [Limtongia smithiae]|uniref:WD40-repeat-containing domain protein n=1 Tax=Limtongia smithiae TaxID=1125753 RepID=UPI0034CE90B2